MPNLDLLEKLLDNKLTYGISLSVLGILVALNLIGTNTLATQGFAVNDLELKTISLEEDNRIIRVKIEEQANLRVMSSLAEDRGFIDARNIVFMPTPPTTALR